MSEPQAHAPDKQERARILEAVEDRFAEIEYAALHSWNSLDSDDPESEYRRGFLEAIKYTRREYRRALSKAVFGG